MIQDILIDGDDSFVVSIVIDHEVSIPQNYLDLISGTAMNWGRLTCGMSTLT